MKQRLLLILLLATALGASSCAQDEGPGDIGPTTPGTSTQATLPADEQAEFDALTQALQSGVVADHAELIDTFPGPSDDAAIDYDPLSASGFDTIQASGHALTEAETAVLAEHGFVLTDRHRFPSFAYGYESIYAQDLPVYISADSILHALHRSYEDILKSIELEALIPELDALLTTMHERLADAPPAGLSAEARADVDLYLAVARALLTDADVAPIAGADASDIDALVEGAQAASGMATIELFGAKRRVDFSQFLPRSHYTESPELKRYFRAMIWLGRIDLRVIETQDDGSQVFHRRQLESAVTLNALMGEDGLARWKRIDDVIGAFVGVSDNMTPPELDLLSERLGVQDLLGLAGLSDDAIAQTVADSGFGRQAIASHIMINGPDAGTLPLNISYLVLGQRYVIDSHVFSNVVYDRVQAGNLKRMIPSPLDAAFAALGNNQAATLLADEMATYPYAPDLHKMRILVDAHDDDFWNANLYNLWLSAIRALSSPAEGAPAIAATPAWGRRVLNTQLASWAELRHDTLLYAKQSYTGGVACEFPDAYVDPYPAFYARVADFARLGAELIEPLSFSREGAKASYLAYFDTLEGVATRLQDIAERQLAGQALTEDQLAFINDAVAIQMGCGDPLGVTGWYAQLFFYDVTAAEYDPTIADVHTQPTDAAGAMVGRVLHVGTGMPRLMVVTVDTCDGPRAYAGVASSYYERVTEDFERLTDEIWAEELMKETPPDTPWMQDLVVRD